MALKTWTFKVNGRTFSAKMKKDEAGYVAGALRKAADVGKYWKELSGVLGQSERSHVLMSMFGNGEGKLSDPEAHRAELSALLDSLPEVITNTDTARILAEAKRIFDAHLPIVDNRKTPEEEHARIVEGNRIAAEQDAKYKAQAEAKREAMSKLPAEYPYLVPLSDTPNKSTHAGGAANLKRHLQHEFPGVEFRLKSDCFSGGDSIDVYWTDGPGDEVKKIADLYQEGDFDGMIDLYSYRKDDAFTDTFGGAKYVMTNRRISDESYNRVAAEMGYTEASYNSNYGNFEGVDIPTSDMIRRATWGRSFYNTPADNGEAETAEEKESEPEPAPEAKPEPAQDSGVTYGEYKGHPTITLDLNGRDFSFGLSKARAIIAHYDAIKTWVESQE